MGRIKVAMGAALFAAASLANAALPVSLTESDGQVVAVAPRVRPTSNLLADRASVVPSETPVAIKAGAVAVISAGGNGSTAGTPPGTQVYRNETAGDLILYRPGANQRMADDITLANGGCPITFYSLRVAGLNQSGSLTFDLYTELWNGDPCVQGSAVIAGTEADTPGIPNNGSAFDIEISLDPTVPVPATVWLAATFSTNDSGWIRAGQAEVGSTTIIWSEDNVGAPQTGCILLQFQSAWGGFWASMNCTVPGDPVGACCNGISCTQTTQGNCAAGVWKGPFTSCQPNPCQTGACCSGGDFGLCNDTTQDQCPGGFFHAGATCAANACGPTFKVFENSFATGIFDVIATGTKYADDLEMGPGAPCDLAGYEILAAGDGQSGPTTFNMHAELWTNNDRGTPTNNDDDTPGTLIPGTTFDFVNVPADLFTQRLLAGPYNGIQLPKRVWVVMTTSSDNAGPVTAGLASIGFSVDGFAIFNAPGSPNVWTPGYWYDGFDPTHCPGSACIPAGSFRVQVWCQGNPPTGACCDDVVGTCTNGLTLAECSGRWAEGATCDAEPFDPPCGASACCFPIEIPPNPPTVQCQNATPTECADIGGAISRGDFCPVTCPPAVCLGRTGDCFSAHAGVGCEDAFCCGIVCDATTGDPFCCRTDWDDACASDAAAKCERPLRNDYCGGSQAITGPGLFDFDNTTATTDGPVHSGCGTQGGDEQISNDLWYCWTATCTNRVLIGTCGQTTVDTKIAVYDGCACPPGDANLLDCNDDACSPLQSMAAIEAVAGHSYLIRVGSYPGEPGGIGKFSVLCGPPNIPACTGAAGDCCTGHATGACSNEFCCETVCACDPYCCTTEWDNACATTGFNNNHCGAGDLCEPLCSPTCAAGPVNWVSPPNGVVDARRPHSANNASATEGIRAITVDAPAGANLLECWQLCETQVEGTPNGVESVTDEGGGRFTLHLKRAITQGAATMLTHVGSGATATFFSHPSNVNADSAAAPADILDLIDNLNGIRPLPFGLYSGDIDHSNIIAPGDILEEIDLLNGAGEYRVWNGTAKPVTAGVCP